jgi:hypothetical protein
MSEYASVAITLISLGIAAICDLRTREVPDKVWLLYGPLGLALTAYRTLSEPSLLSPTAISSGFSILVAFGIVYFGLGGGADGKAVICLALTLPIPPTIIHPALGYAYPFLPVVVVVTGYTCSFSIAIWILARNLALKLSGKRGMFEGLEGESVWKKALALMTGYPTDTAKLSTTFYLYPMEKVIENEKGVRRTLQAYTAADVDRKAVIVEFEKSLQKVGSPHTVWVTPGIPLLVFIFAAVIITLILGDPVVIGLFQFFKLL